MHAKGGTTDHAGDKALITNWVNSGARWPVTVIVIVTQRFCQFCRVHIGPPPDNGASLLDTRNQLFTKQ